MGVKRALSAFYSRMAGHFGPTGWWPGESAFEVAAGAILTQNTAWGNVEKAIVNLKAGRLLSPRAILDSPIEIVEAALRPSGYFRVKTRRLRSFCEYLVERHAGSMKRMSRKPLGELRPELLAVHGIGPETADDILLYACGHPVFVVDTYTRRILSRHGLAAHNVGYEPLRELFEKNLGPDVELFKEYHGLIVLTGSRYCKATPKCGECPLRATLKTGQPILGA